MIMSKRMRSPGSSVGSAQAHCSRSRVRAILSTMKDVKSLVIHPSKLMSLTHCILVDSSTVRCWTSLLVIFGVSCHVASDLGLHCLTMILLRVSR